MNKILIIEDNIKVRENTAEIIQLANYEVLTAANGKEGVELALQHLPDLIVCDIMMPVLDGYGVYHLLSKHNDTSMIPFIFLSAKAEKEDVRKGMQMGADDYIMKPFDGIELLQAIEIRLKKSDVIKHQYTGPEAMGLFLEQVKKEGKVQLTSSEREEATYIKKQVIYQQGQNPRVLYYIIDGKVKVSMTNDDGKELITNILMPGEYFGYAAIIDNESYTENAQALENSTLMLIPREDFVNLLTNDMQVAQAFIKILSKNIKEKEENLLSIAYSSLRKKVAFALIQLFDKYNLDKEENTINLSRENMAQLTGIATESLIRTLGDFKDEKMIAIEAGKVIILKEDKLRLLKN